LAYHGCVLACLQCQRNLVATDTLAGPVPGCAACGHRWLSAAQLAALQAGVERRYTPDDVRALRDESKARKRAALQRPVVYCRCPTCGNQMLRRTFGEVSFLLVHFCAAHGYWIHGDDLDGVVDYIARGGEVLEMANATERLALRIRDLERQNRTLEDRARIAGAFIPLAFPF